MKQHQAPDAGSADMNIYRHKYKQRHRYKYKYKYKYKYTSLELVDDGGRGL